MELYHKIYRDTRASLCTYSIELKQNTIFESQIFDFCSTVITFLYIKYGNFTYHYINIYLIRKKKIHYSIKKIDTFFFLFKKSKIYFSQKRAVDPIFPGKKRLKKGNILHFPLFIFRDERMRGFLFQAFFGYYLINTYKIPFIFI